MAPLPAWMVYSPPCRLDYRGGRRGRLPMWQDFVHGLVMGGWPQVWRTTWLVFVATAAACSIIFVWSISVQTTTLSPTALTLLLRLGGIAAYRWSLPS